jgi:NAD(P)-dependent dehydrogenase (short-subunit alcohol dehydrogenase family)
MMTLRKKQAEKKAAEAKASRPSFSGAEAGDGGPAGRDRPPEVKRKILVVGKGPVFTTGVMDYAASLAERLGYDILAMNLNPALDQAVKFFSPYNQRMRAKFAQQARRAWETTEPALTSQGIRCEHVVKFEDVAQAVKALNHEVKRIDFVITDAGIADEEITGEIPLPVFSITGYQGDQKVMAREPEAGRKKMMGKTIALGLGAAALYAAVFLNTDLVMKYFTKGGIYAALPVATVFLVSFVHGAFASNLWSVLGIEATKKVQPQVSVSRPTPRKRPRPQLRIDT